MITNLYLALGNYILSEEFAKELEAQDLDSIKHVDWFKNQYKNEAKEIAYDLPAVFIEFGDSSATRDDYKIEEPIPLEFHLEQKDLGSTAMNSHNQAGSLNELKLVDKLRDWLKKFEGIKHFSTLRYVGRRYDRNNKNAQVHILRFQCIFSKRRNCM